MNLLWGSRQMFFLFIIFFTQSSDSALTINIKKKNNITSKNRILWTNGCLWLSFLCTSSLFLSFKVLFGFYWPTHWDSVLSLCFIPDAAVAEDKPELNGNQQDSGAVQGTWTNTHKQTIKKYHKTHAGTQSDTHPCMQSHADMRTHATYYQVWKCTQACSKADLQVLRCKHTHIHMVGTCVLGPRLD